ncbi:hypothetical protein GCM10027275_54650 [Rhabdobacter roseus]|uniref:Uncharacterized membrane protein (UPF0136 family) n=1 Tax=Rhabdobacter roseus TaxID=1655419 RepID=A0A840U5Y4_9BACT|nr:hypothetical protein [Rhabdobacter roseus]MBB5287480.1 uncharacterized membrane protein (UPF0136 family) [Rhabdobacter roseus]
MEFDQLKAAWNAETNPKKGPDQLKKMRAERAHPVLKKIRRQFAIEAFFFSLLLVFYYDFFDGHQKPLYANLALVATLVLLLVHTAAGYLAARKVAADADLLRALTAYHAKLKRLAVLSTAVRVLASLGLLLFFASVISFSPAKYGLLLALLVVVILQAFFQARMWSGRLKKLKATLEDFTNEQGR